MFLNEGLPRDVSRNHLEGSLPSWVEEPSRLNLAEQTCIEGKQAVNGTADSMGHCEPCHTGYFCLGNMPKGKDTMPCIKGTYNPSRGATSLDNCTPAKEGSYCPDEHMSEELTCPAGTFSSAESFSVCIRAPDGFYSNANSSEPKPCRPGFDCPPGNRTHGTTFDDMIGSPCKAGSYSVEGQASCVPCSPGFFSDVQAHECLPCEKGYHCSSKSTSKSKMRNSPCAAGYYSAEGQKECSPCAAGSFSNLTVNSDCTICEAGFYCHEGSHQPMRCEKGTYRNVTGGSVADDCGRCQMGRYSDKEGSTVCKICGKGESSVVGSTSADNCTYKVLYWPWPLDCGRR